MDDSREMLVDPPSTSFDMARQRQGLHLLSTALNEFADATIDYPRLLQSIARSAADAIGDCALVLLLTPGREALEPAAVHALDPHVGEGLLGLFSGPMPLHDAKMARAVMMSGVPICVPAVDMAEFQTRTSPEVFAVHERIGTQGLLIVPLRVRDEPIGSLNILRYRSGHAPLDDFDVELAFALAKHAALAISNARLLQRTQEELARRVVAEESALFLDAIVENIPDMVFVKDAEKLAFTRFNRAGEELLGISRGELFGKSDLDFFPPEEAAFFQGKDRETLRGKRMVDIAEEPIETRAGRRWLHTKKVPVLGPDGEPIFLLGISQDITERKRADADLRAAKERAELARRELESFSYSVAHDLRAPLRAIDGFSQALLEDNADALDESGKTYLGRIREASQRMAHLIDDLLTLSKTTRTQMKRQKVDLTAVARSCLARLSRGEPARRVSLIVDEDLVVSGDAGLLTAVLDNLFANAWKFTSKHPEPTIEMGCRVVENERVFFVKDDGVGFDPTYAHRLFGVFERLHTIAEFEGTGIGLATVQRIIERHGGRVWAEGEVGRGATFHFTIPDEETSS